MHQGLLRTQGRQHLDVPLRKDGRQRRRHLHLRGARRRQGEDQGVCRPRARQSRRHRAGRRHGRSGPHRHGTLADQLLPDAQHRHQDQQGCDRDPLRRQGALQGRQGDHLRRRAPRQARSHPVLLRTRSDVRVRQRQRLRRRGSRHLRRGHHRDVRRGTQEHRGALPPGELPHHRRGSPRHHQRVQERARHRRRHRLHLPPRGQGQGVPRQPRRVRLRGARRRRWRRRRCRRGQGARARGGGGGGDGL